MAKDNKIYGIVHKPTGWYLKKCSHYNVYKVGSGMKDLDENAREPKTNENIFTTNGMKARRFKTVGGAERHIDTFVYKANNVLEGCKSWFWS